MTESELRAEYGPEYPDAVIWDGVRMPLEHENRFSRSFTNESGNEGFVVSRFMDGSATITAAELKQDWSNWDEDEQIDFCQSCSWLHEQPDYPEMVRHIVQNASSQIFGCISNCVATALPSAEAHSELTQALQRTKNGEAGNVIQALTIAEHPDATGIIRRRLDEVWLDDRLWNDDPCFNWVADEAKVCIQHLLELGTSPEEFESMVHRLADHPCRGNRESCRNWLGPKYPWLR